ncbi:hypothetical protein [Rhodococcus sp. YL-0]|uniref:hypothetical protein n=1 Tax=Rhodococcus sp. YL-0 TaxID=1930581 RepID=UPI001CC022E1|nr:MULTISPECIES: hypothetical protein [unclassified Rhodococcus (in: high G+C Gram-positive bacteria)]
MQQSGHLTAGEPQCDRGTLGVPGRPQNIGDHLDLLESWHVLPEHGHARSLANDAEEIAIGDEVVEQELEHPVVVSGTRQSPMPSARRVSVRDSRSRVRESTCAEFFGAQAENAVRPGRRRSRREHVRSSAAIRQYRRHHTNLTNRVS